MRALVSAFGLLAVCLLAMTQAANAQATRTWVSGVGDDANPCSRTAPCKTFAGAISKTAAAGEINCIDPGGFGALTITKSIAIKCDNVEAGVLVSGTNGFVISAAATDTIWLSGLDFEGLGPTALSLSGISILTAGVVHISNCVIRGFGGSPGNGINVQSSSPVYVSVFDSYIADNGGEGIFSKPTGGGVRMDIDRTRVMHNGGDGIMANGNGGGTVKYAIRNSESADNGADGYVALSSSAVSQILLDASTAFNNNNGIHASGTTASVRFTRATVTGNTVGVLQDGSGQALSYGTNSVDGNGTDGTFGTTPQK